MASAGERALHTALKTRTFDSVYFLYGEDDYLKDARTRELVEAAVDPATRDFNLELRRGGEIDAETLDSLLGTPPMLAERRVVVIRDVDKLKKDARALLLRYVERAAPDTVLVLVAPAGAKADKMLAMAYGAAARANGTPARALFNEYMTLLKESGAFPGRPWGEAVTAWSRNTDRWTVSELNDALSALLAADVALKETRLSSDEQLLTSLVLTLCGAGTTRRAA
jgi:DNA polymerase III delta subunit